MFYSSEEPLASVNQTAALMEVVSRSGFLPIHQRGLDPSLRQTTSSPSLRSPPCSLGRVLRFVSRDKVRHITYLSIKSLSTFKERKGKHMAVSGITSSGWDTCCRWMLADYVSCYQTRWICVGHLGPTFVGWVLVSVVGVVYRKNQVRQNVCLYQMGMQIESSIFVAAGLSGWQRRSHSCHSRS